MIANSFCPSNVSHLLIRGWWKSPSMEFSLIDRSTCTVSPGINFSASINYNNFFMSNMNLVCWLDSRIFWWKFERIENERRLSRRLKSSFLFVNEPFTIKCCAATQTKALLYIYWLLMINMLFVEQISFQINFSAGNILCGGDLSITCVPGNGKIKFHRYADMGRTLQTSDTTV